MSDAYVIEVHSNTIGLVVRDDGGFRFFAATADYARLEGELFKSPRHAETAAREMRRSSRSS
jgi:hypothetical protein